MRRPIVLASLAVTATLVAIPVVSYISAFNRGNEFEKSLDAAWDNSQNILAQYGQKIGEAAQVPTLQADDVQRVFTGALEARYGADGSKAAFQWIQEQNPSLSAEVYTKIQRMIEAGRDEFKTSQSKVLDIKRAYLTQMGYLWTGLWMKIAGYPKLDLAKYEAITTDRAATVFSSGKEQAPLKLR